MRVSGTERPKNPGDASWQRSWLYYQASSIWDGANEFKRNIIDERVLEPSPGAQAPHSQC